MKTAVFIMSCDHTNDILVHFLKSFEKYWPECPYDIYIGSNSPIYNDKYKYINVPRSNWKIETISQIDEIKIQDPSITNLIVFLDDFILNKNISNENLIHVIDKSIKKDIKYLRLKKVEEPLLRSIYYYFKNFYTIFPFVLVRKTHPYYSSLQVALWEIDYLKYLVNSSSNIWNFEEQNLNKYDHYTIKKSIFFYKHVVEKGMWEFYAKDYCIKYINYFNASNRPILKNNLRSKLFFNLKRLKFIFLGYINFSKL